jgi:hypothetical protein
MIINQGMLNQPTSLSILRDELTKLRDAGKTRDVTLPARYEGKLPYSAVLVNMRLFTRCAARYRFRGSDQQKRLPLDSTSTTFTGWQDGHLKVVREKCFGCNSL